VRLKLSASSCLPFSAGTNLSSVTVACAQKETQDMNIINNQNQIGAVSLSTPSTRLSIMVPVIFDMMSAVATCCCSGILTRGEDEISRVCCFSLDFGCECKIQNSKTPKLTACLESSKIAAE